MLFIKNFRTDSSVTGKKNFTDPAPLIMGRNNETIIRETMSALKAMRDYTNEREDDVFSQLVIDMPLEFQSNYN